MNKTERITMLDSLKGLAVIAVVLYHFGGVLPYGYLGVDVFFVISGYFFVNGLLKQCKKNQFHYWKFVFRKIVRLWPLILIAGGVSLLCGFWTMLPDDYENLSESVIASALFANNILQCITTRNYWNVVNQYKPLMHLWYVSVLMQAYVILPVLYVVSVKICKNAKKGIFVCNLALSVLSAVIYLLPLFHSEWKFYYLPFRIFELTFGGQLVFVNCTLSEKSRKILSFLSFIVLAGMLCAQSDIISKSAMLFVTVMAVVVLMYSSMQGRYATKACSKQEKAFPARFCADRYLEKTGVPKLAIQNVLAEIGRRSYSIYIWHQVIAAFLFYSMFGKISFEGFILYIFLVSLLSILSFDLIEKPLGSIVQEKKKEFAVVIGSILFALVICSVSFRLYMNAGVVRDVPELGIDKANVHRHMHAEYCDRPYAWNHDFSEENKVHIFVLGNSFARDWANILYEYDADNKIEISYAYYPDEDFSAKYGRIDKADYVFYAQGPGYDSVPEEIIACVPLEKLYIIGNKNYGESNGMIYARRHCADYYDQSVTVPTELLEQNRREALIYGNHYINLLEFTQNSDGSVCVFTDEQKFISQDCMHLTQAGAQYYARLIRKLYCLLET